MKTIRFPAINYTDFGISAPTTKVTTTFSNGNISEYVENNSLDWIINYDIDCGGFYYVIDNMKTYILRGKDSIKGLYFL